MKKYFKDVDGLSIEFLESDGNSDPIFIFHGNSSGGGSYEPLLTSEIGKKYRFIAVSFPGHGNSTYYQDDDVISIAKLGKFTHDVTHIFDADRYIIVGQSLGGHALLESLHLHKNACGICLVSAPPFSLGTISSAFLEDPTAGLLFKRDLNDDEIDRFAIAFLHHNTRENIQSLTSHIRNTRGVFRESLGASLVSGIILDEVESLRLSSLPALFMRGEHDRFINSNYYESLATYIGPVNIVNFPDAGHAINMDCPHLFAATLDTFISDIFGRISWVKKSTSTADAELAYAE